PKRILVASLNPVKIAATLTAFTTLFPTDQFLAAGPYYSCSFTPLFFGISVPSGVPPQPLTSATTRLGAYNRACAARSSTPPDGIPYDFFVGLEGGLEPFPPCPQEFESFAWVVVLDAQGRVGKARTAGYFLAEETARLVREGPGMELGEAEDVVWGVEGSKRKGGSVGLLTGGVITREGYYAQAVVLALVRWRNGGLEFGGGV
ncbi:NTPase, partial [Schizothecium vesticola]